LLDEGGLFVRIELARNRLRLAMLNAQPVQQRDQSGPALILNGAFPLDPGADLGRRPRQRFADPLPPGIRPSYRWPTGKTKHRR
jgi:hypothetical protein